MGKRTYVLDTNILLSDANSLFSFDDNDLIVPMLVLEELDRHKSRLDEVGLNARQVNRTLDEMRASGNSLIKGVELPGGGKLKVVTIDQTSFTDLPVELHHSKVDNMIIAFMLQFNQLSTDERPILVSKDVNVRIKCDSLDIKCEDYRKLRVTSDVHEFYRGVRVIETSEKLIDSFYQNLKLDVPSDIEGKLYPNQIVIIKHVENGLTTKSAITKYLGPGQPLIPINKIESAFGLKPRNKEQTFSLDLLYDPDIKLLTLVGPSGTGKTLLALAASLDQLRGIGNSETSRYNKLIVTRPVQPVGKDIGFLPGTLEEKMEPWIAPIRDNLNFLMGSKRTRSPLPPTRGLRRNLPDLTGKPVYDDGEYLSLLQEKGIIEVEAITFIRGRSIPNAIIVIDEGQNLSMHELKTIITRAGEGTKIIITGDLDQIDNVHVDIFTNGLTHAVERFKDYPIAGHITLLKGERSPLASLASQIL